MGFNTLFNTYKVNGSIVGGGVLLYIVYIERKNILIKLIHVKETRRNNKG